MANTKIEQAIAVLHRWKEISILGNGTLLICHVPHVAPEAWLHILYKGLGANEMAEYETRFPVKFPNAYREFLRMANGVNIFSDSTAVWGYRESYIRKGETAYQPYDLLLLNQERPRGCPDSWLFFGSYSWGRGSDVHFDTSLGVDNSEVFRIARDSTTILNKWSSFNDWFVTEVERLANLFDENGKKKNPQEPTIPSSTFP